MFVLDSSTSIWSEDFKRQLKFVRNLVNSFDIGTGKSQVRVGVITFSDDAHLEFSFDKYTSRNELEDAILAIPYRSGITNTAAALRMARLQLGRYLYDSSGLFVTIVITDGLSQLPHETEREAKNLHTLGVHVYAIGVGKHYDVEELKVIASDPLHNVFEVSSYAVLENIAQSFNVKTCEGDLFISIYLSKSFCYLSIYLIYSAIYLSIYLSIYLFNPLCYLSIYLSMYLSI
ncbi:unnamed protein product [Acanthosepion pharaonis]|uniref:VWFA domain-containing protein n=1 Tax=Acanthosepion pharaonis TaxID=158019 RepID=A0A812DG97_ACAPH|nr:unnamed protein product [Sepia pharaonis]